MSTLPLARLRFDRYLLNRVEFCLSDRYQEFVESPDPIELEFRLQQNVQTTEDLSAAKVTLVCELFPDTQKVAPFSLLVEAIGFFTLDVSGKADELRNLISRNAVAILFPYVRAAVTSITSAANVPPAILPTVNIADMMREAHHAEEVSE